MRLALAALVVLAAGCGALPCPDVEPGAEFVIENFHTVTLPTGECRNVSVRFGSPPRMLSQTAPRRPDATCPARVCLHDALRRHLATTAFSAGHDVLAARATVEYHGGSPFLVLETSLQRELYAIRASDVLLVRIEDARGKLARNVYCWSDHTIGPPVPLRGAQEWAASLFETDRAELLRSLVWWCGIQSDDNRRYVARLRAREDVRAQLARLAASNDKWIAEAAALAQTDY